MSTRNEVFRLARRGETHPDPAIAEAALIWATAFTQRAGFLRATGWTIANVIGFFIVGDTSADQTISQWFDARRIVKLGKAGRHGDAPAA